MILSLDVGFRNTGWVVFDLDGKIVDCGVLMTEKNKKHIRVADDYATRAAKLAIGLKNIVLKYEIKLVVGELPVGGAQSARAMIQMGMANAVVAAVCAILDIPADWATPNEVKLAVCGKRSATKDEMMEQVCKLYPSYQFPKQKNQFEHIADAVGAYLALKDISSLMKIIKFSNS